MGVVLVTLSWLGTTMPTDTLVKISIGGEDWEVQRSCTDTEAFGAHISCEGESNTSEAWSWFMTDGTVSVGKGKHIHICFDCNCPVPEPVQALIVLLNTELR